ncbi:MAG: metallopeptidase TldD-related protein [Kangiellaceae bacterium]|nr:metallopeptidase TldD-related protein [Kangiellaceae bacterium]
MELNVIKIILFTSLLLPGILSTTAKAEPVLIKTMSNELDKFMSLTQSQDLPAYYTSYEITEVEQVSVTSSFGSLLDSNYKNSAHLDVDLRVGNYQFDNTHPLRKNSLATDRRIAFTSVVPVSFEAEPLKNRIWFLTEQAYRKAKEDYLTAKANDKIQAAAEDKSADFSKAPVEVKYEAIKKDRLDLEYWKKRIKAVTKPFKSQAEIYKADANFTALNEARWFVNSEGTKVQHFQKSYYLSLIVVSRSEDGMEIPRHRTYFTRDVNKFPSRQELVADAEEMIKEISELKNAPILNAYSGPAIFSGKASGVLFHEVLGHRLESQRMKNAEDTKTFKHKLNKNVVNKNISVVFDPTLKSLEGKELNGHYRFDNQGVKAQPVTVIDKGILKSFLLSRTLVNGFKKSNGHGRKTYGRNVTSRQSNLIVKTEESFTESQLEKMLIAEVKRKKLDYGLIFDDVVGGYTYTGWGRTNSFNVSPIRVYKLYPDGRKVLHRGVDIIGTPLATFDEILAAGEEYDVINGICYAESGRVPSSLASPPILLSKIEVQRQAKSFTRPPILEPVLDDKEYTQQGAR